MSDIKLKKFESNDLSKCLDLVERSDNTSRTEKTWTKNKLTASMAFDDDELVGIIPFEQRHFALTKEKSIDILWVSAAHVEPEYRSNGIGARLDSAAQDYFPDKEGIFVYRENENSPAYKWYRKIGYHDVMPITALKLELSKSQGEQKENYEVFQNKNVDERLWKIFQANDNGLAGGPNRHNSYWSHKIENHYYQNSYEYFTLIGKDWFAVLGQTDLRDGIKRFDILDLSVGDSISDLVSGVSHFAKEKELAEVRIQLSQNETYFQELFALGFESRWRTSLMVKFFDMHKRFRKEIDASSELSGASIQIETPSIQTESAGNSDLYLFMHDNILARLLTHRLSFSQAIQDGQIVIRDCKDQKLLTQMNELFSFASWSFRHIDYV